MSFFIIQMIYKIEETLNDNKAETLFRKTPGLNNPKNYVLTHNRFNTDVVLIFSDLNKDQFFKMPFRDSRHHEIKRFMSFSYMNLFEPIEHTEDHHIRKENNKNFLSRIEDKIYVCRRKLS